ncbi:MAG: glutamine--tRNA ligase/YqeY domain fusion protein [Acidobacteria bacterium]|nr:glutamine--tRNA ligase/YqeY domain fusion protein [Acidobacteriota bacterium]
METANKNEKATTETTSTSSASDFIREIVAQDLASNKHKGRVATRFPPEPNGYLHIGHAKSICINFGIAGENPSGVCHLRFDDTNPSKEETEYVESIMTDVKWLGFDWNEHLYYASDYFQQLYNYAVQMIKEDKAYVCGLNQQEVREYRGTLTEPGKNSPYRNRSVEENLDLFERMKAGEFEEGKYVLRAKIDMASPNLNMRDPVIYRILKASHHRTDNKWCIYPMYDYAHCLSDSIERITHSICTLEFEDHRPLYDWILDELRVECHPQQIEFARLNISNTVLSKRKLLELVKQNYVNGWDDPRMPTISGMRRRGYTPTAIRTFCERIGVAKRESMVDIALLEHCLRENLNLCAERVMAVLDPLKVVIDNYPADTQEELDAVNNPEDSNAGTRKVPFSKEIYIERSDFQEIPPKGFFRLSPGKEVRLKHAYYITCVNVVKNESGEITEVHCTYDPETKGGWSKDERMVKGTLHWVCAKSALDAEVRLYEHLFTKANPNEEKDGLDYKTYLNPNSLQIINSCKVEPSLANAPLGKPYQFLRQGYFCLDPDSKEGKLVFNRTVGLKDSWAKTEKKNK